MTYTPPGIYITDQDVSDTIDSSIGSASIITSTNDTYYELADNRHFTFDVFEDTKKRKQREFDNIKKKIKVCYE